ncbi:hypothetical protein LROSL1_1276 [Furfurilactobacillus rossiae]|uniref:hypothetical protein n=1 Tax=Furfurilactobacillus rossiae TaxID=231049 RepID=UPI0015C1255F|nr:hypothetical protein [Furfurilactobacillus rossiae]MCF6165021.1 hypothetical protein [Furfurilactobacillus rossiae]QLE64093.1 hypothetical protein LROSL1_1276 [Furfurilactobacillus rossiae]
MKNRPKPINPAMPTNIAVVMLTLGVLVGGIIGWLLPIPFDGSFILGVVIMLIFDFAFLAIYRRVTIAKQKAANAQLAATQSTDQPAEKK